MKNNPSVTKYDLLFKISKGKSPEKQPTVDQINQSSPTKSKNGKKGKLKLLNNFKTSDSKS